jgi:polyisoprenoid-binding protein YceI
MVRMKSYLSIAALMTTLVLVLTPSHPLAQRADAPAQQPPAAGAAPRPPLPVFDTAKPAKLDIVAAKGRYKVQEQLVGIDFPSEAVGTTEAVTGSLVIGPDGSIGSQSKLTVDLRMLSSDQEMRDGYIRSRTLETDKFPLLEFVPRRAQGLPIPLPSPPQAQALGFQLSGDMTLHGVTKPVTWSVIATLRGETVAGRATTTVLFSDFNMAKPSVALLLSADDKIQLEVEFRCRRTTL